MIMDDLLEVKVKEGHLIVNLPPREGFDRRVSFAAVAETPYLDLLAGDKLHKTVPYTKLNDEWVPLGSEMVRERNPIFEKESLEYKAFDLITYEYEQLVHRLGK